MPSSKPTQLDLVSMPTLCKTISLPGDYPPVRLPTYPAIERTSVLPFNATLTTTVPSTGLRGMLVKSSTMPLWTDAPTPTSVSWAAHWPANKGISSTAFDTFQRVPSAVMHGSWSRNTTAGVTTLTASSPPAGYCILGESDNIPYLYVPSGATVVYVLWGASSPSGDAVLALEYVDAGGQVTSTEQTLTGVSAGKCFSAAAGFSQTCFMRPLSFSALNGSSAKGVTIVVGNAELALTYGLDATAVSFYGTPRQVMLPAVKPPALDVSVIPFSNTRVTALSALFTNVTKVLNKEGTVMAGRFNPTTQDVFDIVMADYSQLAPSEKYFFGLEKGFYTYVPLQTDVAEFADDVFDVFQSSSAAVDPARTPWLHLGRTALLSCFRFDDPDGGTNLAVNVDWHVEYRNSSVLWPVAISALSLEEAHRAQLVCLEAGFFFDNVDHKFILSMVSKGLGLVAPMLKNRAPAIASAGMAARGYIRSYLGETNQPKPTTLQTGTKVRAPKQKKVRVKGGKKDKKDSKKKRKK